MSTLQIQTPRWGLPLLKPARIKGAKGGRSSGKSHFFGEMLVEDHIANPDLQSVCIREIQKSLKFSAKKLIEDKIRAFGVSHLFDITLTEIRRKDGNGIIIFQGMQDHTADSIKSLEGFDRAWVEESQSLSKRSLELLEPTIRKPGSELWFTWNPDQPDDPVETLFNGSPDAILVHVNYNDNPLCPYEMIQLAEKTRSVDYEKYAHIWLGEFNLKSDKQVFKDKWRVAEFEPGKKWEPLHGADWGFSTDPTTAVECYINDNKLYIRREAYKVGLELDETAPYFTKSIPGIESHVIRGDNARPETISYLKRKGLPRIVSVDKWPGSVHDGIQFIRTFDEIIIHPDCQMMAEEARLYSYKVNKHTGDIMPEVEDNHNHLWDAVRYALQPAIKKPGMDYSRLVTM